MEQLNNKDKEITKLTFQVSDLNKKSEDESSQNVENIEENNQVV